MNRVILFLLLSVPVIGLSWRTLFNIKSHGFYRFFCWECILWLLVTNYKYWFLYPFSWNQILSWILLIISGFFIVAGVHQMKRMGKSKLAERGEQTLFAFEKTTSLITTGIFKFIRHPLYSSLLFLTWGIFLKKPDIELFLTSILSTIFLYITSRYDEKECIQYFGQAYIDYMKKSKGFIPYIL